MMAGKLEKFNKRRLRSSYFSVVVSISLVLLMLGLLAFLVLNAKRISDHVKENFAMTILLNPEAKELEIKQLQKELDVHEYVKETEFVDKEEAAKMLSEELEEDFVEFLGFNPLSNAIVIYMRADFASEEFLDELASDLEKRAEVEELIYDRSLLKLMNDNIQRIGMGLIGFSLLFIMVSIGLINGSIRLSIYSKRFLLRTMQLVGATKTYIRRPFLLKSLQLGFLGAILACLMLAGLIYLGWKNLPELEVLREPSITAIIFGSVIVLGLIISWISTFFAVRKYLNLNTDQLYA
jgi:cell division transport system permease protein